MTRRLNRAAALLFAIPGLGFAISTPLVLAYQARRGELPMTPFGFRLLGGPYEALGTDRLTGLGWALAWLLVGSSVIDVVAGIRLWRGERSGAGLGIAASVVDFALGVLFALPLLLVAAPLRIVLLIAVRGSRRPG
jgi:hypothetical protein